MKKDRNAFIDLLDGYEIPPEHKNSKGDPITGKTFFSRTVSGSVQSRARTVARPVEALKSSIRRLVYTSTRVYGLMLLFFGAFLTVARILLEYLGVIGGSFSALATGISVTLFGVILMMSDKPIGVWAESFAVSDYVFFEFLCIKRLQRSAAPMRGYPVGAAIAVGALLATVGTFVHPVYVVIVLAVVSFVALSLASPEFSFLLTVMLMPYLDFLDTSLSVLGALLLVCAVSFARKVAFGKRVYVFEQYDLLILLLMAFVLVSGIFVKGIESFDSSLLLAVSALGYFLASNLVTNRRLADRLTTAIIISSFPASVYATVDFAVKAAGGDPVYGGIGFYSGEVFAAFLLVSVLFTVSNLVEAKKVGERIFYSVMLLSSATALAVTLNYLAMISLIFGVIIYFVLKLRRLAGILTVALIILPNFLFLLPPAMFDNTVAELVFGDPEARRELLSFAMELFLEKPIIGIGMGADSFSDEISGFGIKADNCKNTFLELACEAGVIALIAFILIIAVSVRHRSVYRQYVRSSQVRTVSKTAAIVFAVLCIYAATTYIFASVEISFLFWCVLGLSGATLRIAKREHDDRIMYYNDVVSSESSDVDVQIDGFEGKN